MIADLDDFKNVNDGFGHEVGNDVLRAFADVITDTLRDVDVAARLGGEEFAMLLPQTDLEGGLALAERIRAGFAATPLTTPDGRSCASRAASAWPQTRRRRPRTGSSARRTARSTARRLPARTASNPRSARR